MAEFWSEETLLLLDTVFLASLTTVQGWPAAASETASELCWHRRVHKRGTESAAWTVHRTLPDIY